MDIEANLRRQRELAAFGLEDLDTKTDAEQAEHYAELAELVEAMHDWFDDGGYLPAAWRGCK